MNVIEDLLWSDVFSADIIKYTLLSVGGVAFFRIIAKNKLFKHTKAMVYLTKAMTYGFLVIMVSIYFVKVGAVQSINVFTGFTFLFSAVEVVDNLFLMVEEWRTSSSLISESEKKLFRKELKHFNCLIRDLMNLEVSVSPGRVSRVMKKYLMDALEKIETWEFYEIDKILKSKTGEEFLFTRKLQEIQIANMAVRIRKNDEKKKPKSLSFNKIECDEFRDLLRDAIACKRLFGEELSRLFAEKKNMELL